jgi:hypothetical protein
MYSVPIGQQGFWSGKALGKMCYWYVTILILFLLLALVVQIVYPSLMIFVFIIILGFCIVLSAIVCTSLVGSARESLDAAERERRSSSQVLKKP